MDAVHGRQVGAVLIAKLDRCTRSVADLASLIDTFSRRGVALISAAESLDTSSAGGRLVVNVLGAVAQWEREATAERTSAALQVLKQQGRATGGVAPYGFQFIAGRRAMAPGRAGDARSDHRRPPRRPLMGQGGRQAQRHRAPHPHRRPVDAPGRPPSPPSARTGARRRSVKGAQGPDLGDSHTVTNRNRAPPRSRSTGPRHVRRNVGAYVLASLLHSQVPVATNQPSSRYCVW